VTAVLGRERELTTAEAFLDAPIEGIRVLLYEGEAGIGKTTLWNAAVPRARELEFRVLEARRSSEGLAGVRLWATRSRDALLERLQHLALDLRIASDEAPEGLPRKDEEA
jgi:hypothetical protein